MLEDGPTECERCGGQLRRVFHPTGIIFKGGGFYKTDSRSAKSGDGAGSSGDSSGSGDSGTPAATSTDRSTGDKGSAPKPSTGGAAKGSGGSD